MYKYSLHKKSIKHYCPKCKKKRFVLYIDNNTLEFLSENVGRCDREINCGYHYKPKDFFKDQGKPFSPFTKSATKIINTIEKIDFHKYLEVQESISYENNFVKFLFNEFDFEKTKNLIEEYKIGTSKEWYSGTIFWQIDHSNKVRGGKIIIYDTTGKRTKYIHWIHALKIKTGNLKSFNLKQCLFGEHLISKYNKPIAVVESEKTACVMSLLFNKYLWLATGSLQGLNYSKIKILKNRKIILYPDLGIEEKNGSPFLKWKMISDELKRKGFDIETSTLLERNCTKEERQKGLDIADYFIKNKNKKTRIIKSKTDLIIDKMYPKNKSIITLIKTFDLTDRNGKRINVN